MAHVSKLIASDIDAYFESQRCKSLLRFITCGSVDDGKSTLIGRLLYESKMVFEDQLSALHFLAGEAQSQASAVSDARQAEEIAISRYKGGLVSYLDVVFAQQTVLANERTAAQITGQRLVASVVLIKTLGGGWAGGSTP